MIEGIRLNRKLDYDVVVRDRAGRVTEVVKGRVQPDGTIKETMEKVE